jgi:hypothetical protein
MPHRRARRSRTSSILSNPAWRWPHRGPRQAPTACILSVCGFFGNLEGGLIVEHAAHKLHASCLILSGSGLVQQHTMHQLHASCLCVASSGSGGRPHRRARRSRTSCILSNPVWRWHSREACQAPTSRIPSVCGIVGASPQSTPLTNFMHPI